MVEFNLMNSSVTATVQNLPNRDRLSVLISVILLAFTLTHFIEMPIWEPSLQLPGIYLALQFSIQNIVLFLVAGLTAAGADWLFHDHPALAQRKTVSYWMLPALTVIGIGIPLLQLPFGIAWWVGLFIGGAVLTLVLIGEYISIDSHDIRQPLAAAVLIAVSFSLFLVLMAGLHMVQMRVFILVPAVFLGTWLVSLRSLHLRMHGEWLVYESVLIAFIISQFSAGLIYWPISSLQFSLLLLGPAYALNSIMISLIEGKKFRELVVEPLIVITLTLGAVLWIR
jgi:hypothetical protein